jgi:hypothetical protein
MIASGLSYEEYIAWIGNPMWDTMWDLIVTLFGGLIFYLFIFVDKLCGYKFCKSVYRDVVNKKGEESQNNTEKLAAPLTES